MEGIILHDGIYVYIENGDLTNDSIANADKCTLIIDKDSNTRDVFLYGGRVELRRQCSQYFSYTLILSIDGITINDIKPCNLHHGSDSYSYGEMNNDLSFPKVTAYLNQIEHLGIDTFLDNYKKNLEDFKAQMNEMATALENELKENKDSGKALVLQGVKNLIFSIIIILFSLSINMNAGLDNSQYEEAYEAIIAQCITD
jgi:hypothetical protein